MASTVPLPSHSFQNFSEPPQFKCSVTTNHHTTLPNITHKSSQLDCLFLSGSDKNISSTVSHYHTVVETEENQSTAFNDNPTIVLKFSTKRNNAADQNLVKESVKVETCERKSSASDGGPKINVTGTDKRSKKVETWEKKSTTTNGGPKIVIKLGKKKHKQETSGRRSGGSAFSVSLSKEEMEADLIAMGGSIRPRRIKKKPKSVQKVLDNLFLGKCLESITPEDFRVPDSP